MKYIPFLFLLASCGGVAAADVTTTSTTTTVVTTTTTTIPVTTTSTTTTTLPDTPCAQWYPIAMQAGWTPADWPTLSFLIERESTCDPSSSNWDDPNGGSHGLLQVNGIWLNWFLPDNGIANQTSDLYDPLTNLRAARAIWQRQDQTFSAWGL